MLNPANVDENPGVAPTIPLSIGEGQGAGGVHTQIFVQMPCEVSCKKKLLKAYSPFQDKWEYCKMPMIC